MIPATSTPSRRRNQRNDQPPPERRDPHLRGPHGEARAPRRAPVHAARALELQGRPRTGRRGDCSPHWRSSGPDAPVSPQSEEGDAGMSPDLAPSINVATSHLGVRITCSKWGCTFDEYVGQTIPLVRLNTIAAEHLASHEG